jgi:hypothetical protein
MAANARHETSDLDELRRLLLAAGPASLSGVIGIDGIDGAGKSTLAKSLCELIGGTVLSVDGFVAENQGGYVPHLNVQSLKRSVGECRRPLIVEGVCLLAVLKAVSVKADVLIYVKRLGGFYDPDAHPDEPVEELVRRFVEQHRDFVVIDAELSGDPAPDPASIQWSPLREEIVRYHAEYRPSQHAAIVWMAG